MAAQHSIADDPNQWQYFTWEQLDHSPSRQDGLSSEDEQLCRTSCVNLIMDVGRNLMWHISVTYLGIQLCHRYFAAHSYKRNDRYSVSLACIYLAGKVRDSPKALTVVMQAGEHYRHRALNKDPTNPPKPWDDVPHMQALREEVLDAERAVLYTIGFDLDLLPPYRYLFYYHSQDWIGQHVFQAAWIFVNGTAYTQMSLVYKPQEIATAAVYAAASCLQLPPLNITQPDDKGFSSFFNMTAERLQEVIDRMLDVYIVHAAQLTGRSPADTLAAAAAGAPPAPTGRPGEHPRLTTSAATAPPAAAATAAAAAATPRTEVKVEGAAGQETAAEGAGGAAAAQQQAPAQVPVKQEDSNPQQEAAASLAVPDIESGREQQQQEQEKQPHVKQEPRSDSPSAAAAADGAAVKAEAPPEAEPMET